MVAFADPFRRKARRLTLQQGADIEEVRHFLRRQALHRDTSVRNQAYQPFGGEPAKSLAKSAAAVGNFFGEVADYEPLPRREAAADDSLPDRLENHVDGFAMPVRFGGRYAWPRV